MAVKRYDGSAWQVVAGKGDQGTSSSIATWVKTASGGETSLSGNDDNSQPLSYTVGQELVFINGTLQKRGVDYTATTGNSITGLTALIANDVVTVWTVNAFSVTNAISNTLVDAKGDLVTATGADVPARLAVGSNDQVLTADSSTATGLKWATPASGTTFVGVSLYKSGNQSLTSGVGVNATFDTELFDTNGYHSTSSNTDRITIPSGKDGYYLVTARANFAASSTGIRIGMIRKNAGATQLARFTMNNSTSSADAVLEVSTIVNLVATDYVVFEVYQDGTGSLNLQGGGEQYTIFSAAYLGV